MDDKQFEAALADRRRFLMGKVMALQRDLGVAQEQLAAVDTLLKDTQLPLPISSKGTNEPILDSDHSVVGPVSAIIDLFRSHESRVWTPPELRDQLQRLKDEGKLLSNSENFLGTVHTVLKPLLKRKAIERAERRDGKSAYRLTMKERESLHKEENPVTEESGNGIFTSSVGQQAGADRRT